MRTTLTLDDDVAALLGKIREERDATLKEIVNEALRAGLRLFEEPPRRRKPFRVRPLNVGRCLVGSLDNIAEVLAIAEGEDYK